jgi:uncharacterized membrane protein YgaE (UPF0421/DUF939 family)
MRFKRVDIIVAVQMAIVSMGAFLAGSACTMLFHRPTSALGGLWAMISGLVVLQSTRRETLSSAWIRVRGTFIGAVVAAAYLSVFHFTPLGMGSSILVAVLLCHAVGLPDHARLASITVGLIMVISSAGTDLTPLGNAGLRFGESCLGAGLAVLVSLAWPGQSKCKSPALPAAHGPS